MPRGANPKREREYAALKKEFQREGRYPGREEEVAARIVNKQRRQLRETEAAREKDRAGRGPDRDLPLEQYERLTIPQIMRRLEGLSYAEVRTLERYERQHKNRKTLLQRLERRLQH
ncbi:MAG: hypothetical protein KIS79_09875 [Burkholderiales bacterium]|nr:hypothetical protein [Burkholderiales bacterium]